MARLATFGLLATSGIGQALGAPIMDRGPSPAPEGMAMSRVEQDMARAMELIRRGDDPYSGVDWNDPGLYKDVDWKTVDYGPHSPSVYGTPQAMPSPTLSSLGRAYEHTFGQPSPLATPPVMASNIVRGFSPSLPPMMTATPVPVLAPRPTASSSPAPLLKVDAPQAQAPFKAPAAAPTAPLNFFDGIAKEQNAVAIAWHGDEQMTFSFFANAGPYQPNLSEAYKSVTLQPGASETVQLPKGWSGRVQKMTGAIDSDATWAELTFDGWEGLSWFDVSAIRGYNGPAVMYLSDTPNEKAGSPENRLKDFPNDKQKTQPRGSAIPATEGYDGTIRFDVIDFWRAHAHDTPAHKEAYIVNNDDSATFTGPDKHLVIEWF